jgi:hypothetical protein
MKKIFSLFFVLLSMTFNSIAQKNAADTSAKKWNGVWDPTDPNCPCYNIQKQAEKEYQEMLKKEKKDEREVKNNSGRDSILLHKKSPVDGTGITVEKNPVVKNNRTDNISDVKIIKHKTNKKRKKGRDKKFKKGKAVCPEI